MDRVFRKFRFWRFRTIAGSRRAEPELWTKVPTLRIRSPKPPTEEFF